MMSMRFFIVNILAALMLTGGPALAQDSPEQEPIVITSETLTADSRNGTAVFEGSVIARTEDITMHSNRMTVYYDNSQKKVRKIHALGDVKVNKGERALFSDEAIFLEEEGKIIFTGNPRAVEGENLISGRQIIFYLEDDRAVVEGSRVILQNKQGLD